MPSFPRRRESRDFKPYQSLNIPKNQSLDSRLRGNDGVGIAILICFGRQVSDDLLSYGLTADYRIVG
ncbi:hypothetical protein QP713_01835 [Neisseria mucosa]|uniref:Uncharacterized protein n=1 Tax=Neisseria mucosa TaxID=488 RepID=A0AAW6ZB58_NEIMU|nr:hypothetical protein [Neisseria mucosa]WNU97542.1 hypothetical protein RSJ68_01915 [Neisseria sp. DTU_2020_1000833_1_SI_GRL_NUU_006]MDK6725647.1 hypothetical protein [Neisseria mucosa]MDK6869969.1 hypothetical protein [Neisseria mucosa]MDK8109554.1 hypothetical protein [Neisseria mucosa]MDK8360837.1 hypothetical protein [Neisseria mucosa]